MARGLDVVAFGLDFVTCGLNLVACGCNLWRVAMDLEGFICVVLFRVVQCIVLVL